MRAHPQWHDRNPQKSGRETGECPAAAEMLHKAAARKMGRAGADISWVLRAGQRLQGTSVRRSQTAIHAENWAGMMYRSIEQPRTTTPKVKSDPASAGVWAQVPRRANFGAREKSDGGLPAVTRLIDDYSCPPKLAPAPSPVPTN